MEPAAFQVQIGNQEDAEAGRAMTLAIIKAICPSDGTRMGRHTYLGCLYVRCPACGWCARQLEDGSLVMGTPKEAKKPRAPRKARITPGARIVSPLGAW